MSFGSVRSLVGISFHSFAPITRHYSTAGEQETTKQTLTTSKYSSEFTYSNFPCHLKVNRDKLALINRLWKCKIGLMNEDNR